MVTWVRRKLGPNIVVWRKRSDGTLGCAAPCVLCQQVLTRFDLKVQCSLGSSAWFSGRLTDLDAPKADFTSGQRRHLKLGGGPGPIKPKFVKI